MRSVLVAAVALALAVSCGPHHQMFVARDDASLRAAALAERTARADAPPASLIELAWLDLLHLGRADEARVLFARAHAAGARDWLDTFGWATTAELTGATDEAVRAWLGLTSDAPGTVRRLAGLRLARLAGTEGAGLLESLLPGATPPSTGDPLADLLLADATGAPSGAKALVRWHSVVRAHSQPHIGFAIGAPEPTGAPTTTPSADGDGFVRLDEGETGFYETHVELRFPRPVDTLLILESDAATRVRAGGHTLVERDSVGGYPARIVVAPVRFGVGCVTLTAEMAVAMPGARFRLRVLPVAGLGPEVVGTAECVEPAAVTPGASPSLSEPSERLIRAWVRLLVATELEDIEAATVALDELRGRIPSVSLANVLEAAVARWTPVLPPASARERELAALSEAVRLDPSLARARARLAEMLLNEGRSEEVLGHLEAGERFAPESAAWDELRLLVFLDRGWETEARTALSRALGRRPDDCGLLKRRLDLSWDAVHLRPWEQDPAAERRCSGVRRAHVAYLRERGQLDEAAALLAEVVGGGAVSVNDHIAYADVLLAGGRVDEAIAVLERVVAAHPGDVDLAVRLAEALVFAGRDAEAEEVRRAADARPEGDTGARRRLLLLDDQPFWRPFHVDGRTWLDEQRATAERLGGFSNAVVMLDQQVSRFFGDGSALHYVHTVILVRDGTGAERFGEVRVPDGTEVIVARTLHPDGTVSEPEELLETETFSMPSLRPGDAIEYVYLIAAAPRMYAMPDVLGEPYYLQSYQAPILRSEYTAMAPPDLELLAESTGSLPEPVRRRLGHLRAWTWRRTSSEQMVAEPMVPDARASLASVRVGNLDWTKLAARMADTLLPRMRLGPVGRALAHELARRHESPRERTRAAFEAVQKAMQERTDVFLDISAAHGFAMGAGERLVALAGLLNALDVAAELVLVKPLNRTVADGPLPDPLSYGYPVLHAWLPDGEVWLDPSFRFPPFDYLPPVVQGRPGISLDPRSPGAERTTARYPDDGERREVRLELRVRPGGDELDGQGEEALYGIQALTLRGMLAVASQAEREELVTALVRSSVPEARVTASSFANEDAPDAPLVLRYAFRARLPRSAMAEKRRILLLGLLPEAYAAGFVRLSRRQQPLFFNVNVIQRLDLSIALPPGMRFDRVPPSRLVDTFLGRHRRVVRREPGPDGERLVVRKELDVPVRIVEAADYVRFSRACRRLDQADTFRVEINIP